MQNKPACKLFIVDDDPFCTALYQQHLLNLGYTDIHTFSNGQDCLNNLTEQPQIILLDYEMEPYNGLEVLKKIKRFNPNIYLLVISGQDDMQVAINALKYGAFDYVIKGKNELEKITSLLQKIGNVMEMLAQPSAPRLNRLFSFLQLS